MGADLYFFEQFESRKVPKRYRKLPEELPESLRFAHLNPKVAALLASKDRLQKVNSTDPFRDGLGKKSLLPDINAAFQNVRNQFDSALFNDEDSQRYLYEEAKLSSSLILHQLSQIIYIYEDIYKLIPKSLEYHLMSGYNELTNDIVVAPREWQTQEMKEQFAAKQQEAGSEEEISDTELFTGRLKSRLKSERAGSEIGSKLNFKKSKSRIGTVETGDDSQPVFQMGHRSESRVSVAPSILKQHLDVGSRVGSLRKGSIASGLTSAMKIRTKNDFFSVIADTPSDAPSAAAAAATTANQMTINFQLSNAAFEDKGWIMLKGSQEQVDQNQILEYCIQKLQESLKSINTNAHFELEQGYDRPVIVCYYGDHKKAKSLKYRKSSVKQSPNLVHKGGKPQIPCIVDEKNEGRKLMQTQHIDGSTIVYYPSGRPAVIYSAAGLGRPGFYTIVYDDGIDSKMLACFTPSGHGVCYHDNGTVRFLSTEKGGHTSAPTGKLIQKWKWPQANVKIAETISFSINNHVLFRCVGQNQMTIVFNCQKEMARFSVGRATNVEYKSIEETDQLLTPFTFTSKSAKELQRIFAPNKKHRKKVKKNNLKGQSSEWLLLLQDFPDKVTYELEADKELAKLQRKARILVDDWMEHYRITLGLASPHLQSVREKPNYGIRNRNIKSARLSDHQLLMRRAIMGVVDIHVTNKKNRIPSAPLAGLGNEHLDEEISASLPTKQDGNAEQISLALEDRQISTTAAIELVNRLVETSCSKSAHSRASTSASKSAPLKHANKTADGVHLSTTCGTQNYCPVAVRQKLLGYENPQCRCNQYHIPSIMDLELDDFIDQERCKGQLKVIMVVSSLFPGISKVEKMLNEIYAKQNQNRTRPCAQSRSDIFRLYKYDITSAFEMSDHTQPLLVTRHNVVPGMILIYCDGKLLFCDHIFNGYGNARTDFKKQIMKSRFDAIHGNYLPKDFRFSPSKGRSGLRSAWGGEIGGAGVDIYIGARKVIDNTLQPILLSNSDSSNSEQNRDIHLNLIKAQAFRYISTSLSTTGFQQVTLHMVHQPVSMAMQPT